MMWKYCLPNLAVQVGKPAFARKKLEEEVRKSWKLNRQYPAVAHVCFESPAIALECSKLIKGWEHADDKHDYR